MKIMKKKGCIKLFRWEIDQEKRLTDPELRIYLLFRRMADWDKRHEHFGTAKVSLRQLHSEFLAIPGWSVTKISVTINGLIKKGFLKRLPESRIAVENFVIFQAKIPAAEQLFRKLEQGVPITEQDVARAEQPKSEQLRAQRDELAQKLSFPQQGVP